MRVYVVRHGQAVSHYEAASDEVRWLHATGRRALVDIGAVLRKAGVRLDAVLASPLVRAVQTAELLASAVGYQEAIEALPALAPDGSVGAVVDELPSRGVAVAVVGHEPSVSALAGQLVGRPLRGFRPGQVACVDDGALQWLLNPDTLELERH